MLNIYAFSLNKPKRIHPVEGVCCSKAYKIGLFMWGTTGHMPCPFLQTTQRRLYSFFSIILSSLNNCSLRRFLTPIMLKVKVVTLPQHVPAEMIILIPSNGLFLLRCVGTHILHLCGHVAANHTQRYGK